MSAYHPRVIKRQRTKGWRMPPNTVYVGRPTKWANPFIFSVDELRACVDLYKEWLYQAGPERRNFRADAGRVLRGKNLACWCHDWDGLGPSGEDSVQAGKAYYFRFTGRSGAQEWGRDAHLG